MASLSVRKLDDHIYKKLQLRAISHHISMEEEVRQILAQVVEAPKKISNVFRHYFGSKNGVDLIIPNQRDAHDPIDFTG